MLVFFVVVTIEPLFVVTVVTVVVLVVLVVVVVVPDLDFALVAFTLVVVVVKGWFQVPLLEKKGAIAKASV